MSAPKVKVPQPTKAETNLRKNQADLLKMQTGIIQRSYKQQQQLMPFLARMAGYKIQMGKHGNIKGLKQNPKDKALNKQDEEIKRLLNEKTLAALKGELPVDPVLERELGAQEETLRQRLQGQFGPGYETSDPGIRTLDEFFRTSEGLRYNARRGELTLAEQLGLARREGEASSDAMSFNMLRSGTIGDPLSFAGAAGNNASGYGAAQQPFQFDRSMEFQANRDNVQNQMSVLGGIGSLTGTAFGAVFPG